MSEKIKYYLREQVAGRLPEKKYDITIPKESTERINYTKKILEERPDLSYIVYFNHISFADPLFAGHIATLIDPNNTRKVIAPISYSHTEMKIKNSGTWAMKKTVEMCGVETFRVIQNYQIDNPKYKYTKEEASRINKLYLNRLRELAKLKIATGVLISPEGRRSDGSLEKGERGLAVSGKILTPTIYIPVGIVYGEEYGRSSLNFGKKLTLNIGEPYLQESRKNEGDVFAVLMQNLAKALPPEMRGYYSESAKIGEGLADMPVIRE